MRCVAAVGLGAVTAEDEQLLLPGCQELSVQEGEAGAAPCMREQQGSASPARATASCSPPLVQTTPSP